MFCAENSIVEEKDDLHAMCSLNVPMPQSLLFDVHSDAHSRPGAYLKRFSPATCSDDCGLFLDSYIPDRTVSSRLSGRIVRSCLEKQGVVEWVARAGGRELTRTERGRQRTKKAGVSERAIARTESAASDMNHR